MAKVRIVKFFLSCVHSDIVKPKFPRPFYFHDFHELQKFVKLKSRKFLFLFLSDSEVWGV